LGCKSHDYGWTFLIVLQMGHRLEVSPSLPTRPDQIPVAAAKQSMSRLDDLLNRSKEAQFQHANLHIHSIGPGGSYDAKDGTMTPAAIVDLAISESLQVISTTNPQ